MVVNNGNVAAHEVLTASIQVDGLFAACIKYKTLVKSDELCTGQWFSARLLSKRISYTKIT